MMKTMANNENDIKELQEKERIEEYRSFLYMELLALKMPYKEILTLVSEELIINSIRNPCLKFCLKDLKKLLTR